MDATDLRIVCLLRFNSRAPLRVLARELHLSPARIKARIEALEREGIIKGYELHLAYERLDAYQVEWVATIRAAALPHVIELLCVHPFVRWVGTAIGEPNLRVNFVTASLQDFEAVWNGVKTELGDDIRMSELNIITHAEHRVVGEVPEPSRHVPDALDYTLLEHLAADPNATLATLARASGMSIEAVRKRKLALERSGVITGYAALLALEKSKEQTWVLIYANLPPTKGTDAFLISWRDDHLIRDVKRLVGAYTHLITVHCHSNFELAEWLDRLETRVPGFMERRVLFMHRGYKYPKVPAGIFAALRKRALQSRAEIE